MTTQKTLSFSLSEEEKDTIADAIDIVRGIKLKLSSIDAGLEDEAEDCYKYLKKIFDEMPFSATER